MRVLLGCAVVLVACFGVSAEEKKDERIDAKKLVGKWSPKEQKKGESVVLEFTKDGRATATATEGGKESKLDGTFKVDGNKVVVTAKAGDRERTHTLTVSKLTDTEMVLKDDTTLVRIKDK